MGAGSRSILRLDVCLWIQRIPRTGKTVLVSYLSVSDKILIILQMSDLPAFTTTGVQAQTRRIGAFIKVAPLSIESTG